MIAHLFFKIKAFLNYRLKAVNAHGLHSPFLFDFYNEVISPKKEFYFFNRLRKLLPAYTKFISENNALFLYRWGVFYKPKTVSVLSLNFPVALTLSVSSTEKNLSLSSLHDYSSQELSVFESEGVSLREDYCSDLIYVDKIDTFSKDVISNYKCIIIQNPHEHKAKDVFWKELCSLKEISISIDLFQFGILLIDKNKSKQHFIVKMS